MKKNLPIKIVIPKKNEFKKNHGGGKRKFFHPVNNEYISKITTKFYNLQDFYKDDFFINNPAVAKITMRKNAIAKSHRPNYLAKTLKIIGSRALDELYMRVTKDSILRIISQINSTNLIKELEYNLSAIENIEPIYPDEKISINIKNVFRKENISIINDVRIKLFDFIDKADNIKISKYFMSKLNELGYGDVNHRKFGLELEYYVINSLSRADIEVISKINGVKSIDITKSYSMPLSKIKTSSMKLKFDGEFEESNQIIGIIDSGISNESILEKDVVGRLEYIPKIYQNRDHGTSVASSIQYGSVFDGMDEYTKKHFKFFDVIVIPNSDITQGPVDSISEDDLFDIITEVMDKKSSEIKIWNLSIGTDALVVDDNISDLAIFLDYIQDKYDVQMIVSAGNYNSKPYRNWPPQDLLERDRITVPADSARALSVGSIADKENGISLSKINEPSPFSRKGPGANYMVKPELVDFGGNMDTNGNCEDIGVLALDKNDNIIEITGTSFSAPRITYKYAKIYDELLNKDSLMAKAFLIHNSRINSNHLDLRDGIKYYGFGQPSYNTEDILNCSDNEITLVFKEEVIRGMHLEVLNFPYPKSLIKNQKYTGEIFMTLVYNPPLNEHYGSQYCRLNFDASFGTFKLLPDNRIDYKGQVPLEKTWDERYEKSQVLNGFKWSPIKSYYRNIKNGISLADGWKIKVQMTERDNESTNLSHEFILLITIKGQEYDQVYNDVVTELQSRGYVTSNLETRQRIRERN